MTSESEFSKTSNAQRPTPKAELRRRKIVEQKETKKTEFLIFDLPLLRCLLFKLSLCSENLRDLLNRIPIARRRRRTQEFLDSTEVADGLHLPAI